LLADGEADALLLGKDEMNLAELPITLLVDRKNQTMITREVALRDDRTGLAITRKVTVTGSEQYGLPTAQDNLVLLALIYLTKRANNFSERRIWFTRSELLKVLGWPDSGQSYARIELSLKRWANVFVLYENAWWDKPKQSYSTKGFGIIDDFEVNDGGLARQGAPLPSNMAWNEVFFQSLEAGYIRTVDLKLVMRLRHATSQQMYRFLGKHFYHSSTLTLDLRTFACEHVGLDRSYKDNGKLKEKLQPALDELEAIGFLDPMSRDDRYAKVGPRQWTITLRRRPGLDLQGTDDLDPSGSPLLSPDPTPQELALIDRGVTPAAAAEIALAHPPDALAEKVEAFDWLVARQDKRVSRNPAGYLAESIRKDYAPPRGFESAAARDRRLAAEDAQRRKVEQARLAAEEAQRSRDEADRSRVDAHLASLSPAALARLREEALRCPALRGLANQYQRAAADPDRAEKTMRMLLDAYVLRILDHPE
jgi:hypothetical protein